MRRITIAAAAMTMAAAAPAPAQMVAPGDAAPPYAPAAGSAGDWYGGTPNPYFYPDGYDPQYGSGGRVPDAADFAASYGCRPIWNAKTGRLMPACN